MFIPVTRVPTRVQIVQTTLPLTVIKPTSNKSNIIYRWMVVSVGLTGDEEKKMNNEQKVRRYAESGAMPC